MPAEREFSRKIAVVVGGGSGIGREVAIQLANARAHVVVADQHVESARAVQVEAARVSSAEAVFAATVDLQSRDSITAALRDAVLQFGGVDVLGIPRRSTRPPPVRISLGPDARDQRLQQLRARAGGGRILKRRTCRDRSC